MFKHLSHFKFALLYIFSKQARFAGKFDERDLLLGHGIDNLTSIRVVVSLCCAIAVYLLVNFVLSSQVVSALLFILVMEVLCWYTMHLPRSGMEQALHNNFAKLKEHRSYRSYFNGRILFTPYGLSLSLKARNAQTVSKDRNEQAKRILSLQPLSTNRFSQWSNKVKEVNHKINAHSHKELSCVQVTQGLSKAQSEHNARLYLSGHGHKSTAMILQSGVSVDDYVIAQGILASTADDRDLPVINSGYITKLPVPLLCDQRLYAGKKITMEAIAQILCASAMEESNKQHRKFVPTDLCLLGFGFEWLPKHSRALRQIMAVGTKAAPLGGDGSPDIHAVEPDFAYEPIVTSTNKLKGHTLLLGTTGSGKTRFFDLLVSQAIMRGDTVIVLDPKGDRDLQRSIIKAARAAEREPYQQIICLDIGRNVSNPLSSNVAVDYAAASTGSLKQFAMDSKKISDTQNVAPLSPFERSRKSLTKKGYFSLINNDFYERQGCDLGFDKAADTKERRSFKYQHRHYISEHNETAASIRATNSRYDDPNFATVTGEDPDNCLFDEINFGLNPTAIFDRGSEVSSRLTSMISGQGSSANFKAYAAMAITAAVECCRLLDENVTLDAIRGYIANHQRFIIAVRDIINKTVVNLNNVYCSRYYNCIYGIKDDKLVRNAYTISVLMANGYKYINLRERASVLSVLENSGLLDASDAQIEDSEKIKQIENIIDNQSLTKEIISDKAASKKTSSKTTTAKENKPRYLAAPAPIKSLQEFYVWMTKNGYLDRDNSIEQIFEVCLMDPVFFQKVTNSIMPSLVSLTSGVLKQLLSADDYKQTNFMEIVRNNKIFYGALHCLKDSITGQNLGKLLMADLAFVAGEINAKNIQGHHQVSVFIDEASELANEVLVQLLNKSRASNFAVTIATQSVADLRARVNSKDVAEQLIANCNNLLSLRVEDMDTANVIANVLPNTVCTHESTTISVGSGGLTGNASASRSLSQQDCEYFPGTMLMQLPNFEFIARLANGSCYKGFIPIIDKENSGHQRPEFTAAHEAQAFAQEQNKRMRSQTFEPRPNNTTNTSANISPTPQRTSDFATSAPMENWACPEQSQPNSNGNTVPTSRQYDLANNNTNTSILNSPIAPVSGLNDCGRPNGITAPLNGPVSSRARLDNFDGDRANNSSLNGPVSPCARLDNFDGDMANNSNLNGPISPCSRLDNFDGDRANNSSLNGPISSCARLDNFDGDWADNSNLNSPVSSCAKLDNFDGDMANNSNLNGPVSSCARLDNFSCSNANTSNLNSPVSPCARLDNFGGDMANNSSLNGPVYSCAKLDNFDGSNANTSSLNGPTSSCARLDNFGCSNGNTRNLNGPTSSCAKRDNFDGSSTNTNSLNAPVSPCSRLDNFDGSNANNSSLNGPTSSCARLDNFDGSNANTSNLNGPVSSCAKLDNFDGDMANNSSLNGPVSSCSRLDNFDGDMANNSSLNGPVSYCAEQDNFGGDMTNNGSINGGETQGARLDNSGKAQDMGQGAKGTWWRKIMECLHICDSYRENTSNEAGDSKCSVSGDEADIYRNRGCVGSEFGASCQQGNDGANTSKNDGDGLNTKDIDGKPLAGGENFVSGKEQPNEKKISGCTFGQNMLKIEIALQDASRDKFNDTATSSLSLAQSLVTLPSSHHDPQRQRFNAYVQARRNAQALQNLKVQARQNPCTPNNSTDNNPMRQSDFAPNLQFNRDAQGNLQTQPDFQERMRAAAQAQAQVQAQAQTCAQAKAQESEARSIQNHATDIELKLSSSRINEELTLEQAAIMLGQDPKDALEANLTPDNIKLDGPTVGRYGYKAGNSRQTLNQETKVYVGNEQSLLYSHFSDEQYHPKSSDDLVQRQSGFTNTASTTGARGEASAASASASASGATSDGSTNRTSGINGIRGIRGTTGALSCNDKRGEPQLSSNSSQAEHNFSPAPIMVSALSTSKSKMDRDYEQAHTYRRQNLKSNERNLLTMGGEIQAQYGLTGLAIWFLRVLFYPLEWALKVLIIVCFNQGLLKNLAIAKELMMLLLAGVLIAWCFKPDQIAVLTKSISDFCSYCYDFGAVVYFALFNGFSQVNEALYADSSILDRLELYAQLLFDHVECALTCFALGLLWGNHYGLISEMHHRSLLGLRTLLRPYSFLNLSLSLSAVALLIGGYFPCLEYALLITWFKIALYGFTITCFYSQHSK